jgi:hypothetical protein
MKESCVQKRRGKFLMQFDHRGKNAAALALIGWITVSAFHFAPRAIRI